MLSLILQEIVMRDHTEPQITKTTMCSLQINQSQSWVTLYSPSLLYGTQTQSCVTRQNPNLCSMKWQRSVIYMLTVNCLITFLTIPLLFHWMNIHLH